MQVDFKINGRQATVDAPPNTFLVHAIREHLHLTGTHVGCDTAQCGACTVHVNGRAVKSCNMLVAQAAGADFVKTSTGYSTGGATVHAVEVMHRAVGGSLGIKASGGIHSPEEMSAMLAAGATRIGASAGRALLAQEEQA